MWHSFNLSLNWCSLCGFRRRCKWCQHDPSSWYRHWDIRSGGHAGLNGGLKLWKCHCFLCYSHCLKLFLVCRRSWRVISLCLASNTWKNSYWFMDTGAILDWLTWSFTSSTRMWWVLYLLSYWTHCLDFSCIRLQFNLSALQGLREPAVLVSVLLRLLWHCHDRLLADDFFQPVFHLCTAHHVWDYGQRPFCRDAAGCSWTVQDRTGCRGQWPWLPNNRASVYSKKAATCAYDWYD